MRSASPETQYIRNRLLLISVLIPYLIYGRKKKGSTNVVLIVGYIISISTINVETANKYILQKKKNQTKKLYKLRSMQVICRTCDITLQPFLNK